MKATFENWELVIRIQANVTDPPPSASGKTRIVSSTHGALTTTLTVQGKPVKINLNAYV